MCAGTYALKWGNIPNGNVLSSPVYVVQNRTLYYYTLYVRYNDCYYSCHHECYTDCACYGRVRAVALT